MQALGWQLRVVHDYIYIHDFQSEPFLVIAINHPVGSRPSLKMLETHPLFTNGCTLAQLTAHQESELWLWHRILVSLGRGCIIRLWR